MQRTGPAEPDSGRHENGSTPDMDIGFHAGITWARAHTRVPTKDEIARASYTQWQAVSKGILLNCRQFRSGFHRAADMHFNGFIGNERGA